MQAFKAATTVDSLGEVRIREVPFKPGAEVEVIILEPSAQRSSEHVTPVPRSLSASRKAALDKILASSYPLGGSFPPRDELYER